MGIVYEAFDEERRVPVALKTLRHVDGHALARFKREFRAVQGLAHRNLVTLEELFCDDDQWFFTMELLEGEDFVSHVTARASAAFESTVRESVGKLALRAAAKGGRASPIDALDEGRLREALRQLLEGLSVLHSIDKVHRDVKPSNVLVTAAGRVVLLDFGLVAEASAEDRSTGGAVVGTPAYMAPEQAASRDVGPAADLYAVGVMLYEILTGRLPFEGTPLEILIAKQQREPTPPADVWSGTAYELGAICTKLLRFDPSLRPTVNDVLQSLSRSAAPRRPSSTLPNRPSTDSPIFIGRRAELNELRASFELAASGKLSTALVCGESGIGKSYTVRRFLSQLVSEHPDAIVLEGRCYERETVPYKTLDGTVDALSRRLSRMPASDVAAILPSRSASLAQVFPAMLRVPQVGKAHAALSVSGEAHEVRQRAFGELRELFTRLALRHPTVIVIDDLQWADDDGLRALTEILRQPDAPPLLFLGTVRLKAGEDASLDRARTAIPGEPRVLRLTNLERDEARELARAFLKRVDAADADAEDIAAEAEGHPLFVEELARHAATGGTARGDVSLDEAIWSRILDLDVPTREMAELVALAGKPIPQEVAAAAAHVEPAEFNRRAAVLRVANLVRTGGARWADAIEAYHDRVREAVLARLDPERRRGLHEALAIAFEASSHGDAETLAVHWKEAGNNGRAARHASAAGDQAAKACAFDRAAQWYEQALELMAGKDADRREIRIKLGDALSNAGRGGLAAKHFNLAAADSAPDEAVDLRRRAAVELLRSGDFERGMSAVRHILKENGLYLPQSRLGLLFLVVYFHLRLFFRGLGFDEREKTKVTPAVAARLDTTYAVAVALTFQDPMLALTFALRFVLLSLSTGDTERIIRALGFGASLVGVTGTRRALRQCDVWIERLKELSARVSTAQSRAFLGSAVFTRFYGAGRHRESVDAYDAMCVQIREGSEGMVYEQSSFRVLAMMSQFYLGRFRDLRRARSEGLRDAINRGDVYATVMMRCAAAPVAWLVEDRPELAAEELRKAAHDGGLHLQRYFVTFGEAQVKLYAGDLEGLSATLEEMQRLTSMSLLSRLPVIRFRSLYLRNALSLAMLGRRLGDRAFLLRRLAAGARSLERMGSPQLKPFIDVAQAGLRLHEGAPAAAVDLLMSAVAGFELEEMVGFAAACLDRAARLRNDESSAEDLRRAAAAFEAEEVASPTRMMEMLIPGFVRVTLDRDGVSAAS